MLGGLVGFLLMGSVLVVGLCQLAIQHNVSVMRREIREALKEISLKLSPIAEQALVQRDLADQSPEVFPASQERAGG
jgi:hypothetical protein